MLKFKQIKFCKIVLFSLIAVVMGAPRTGFIEANPLVELNVTENRERDVSGVQNDLTQNDLTQIIENIENALSQTKWANAIYYTAVLNEKLVQHRTKQLNLFFPQKLGDFVAEPYTNQERGTGLNGESFGVILSKRYINKAGHYIEFMVVNDSDAISEYQLLIKRPQLISELQDATLTQIQSFSAIQKWLLEQKIIEHNVVINQDLMINIFAKGVDNPEVIESVLSYISLEKIESHLKN